MKGRKALSALLALGLLTAIAVFIWLLLRWFLSLPSERLVAVSALVGVAAVPIVTYFTTRSIESRKARDDAIRTHKTALYERMVRELMGMLGLDPSRASKSPAELTTAIATLSEGMIAYASPAVITAWVNIRSMAIASEVSDPKLVFLFEDLLKAIRKDLGHSTWSMQQGDLLRMFINDVDKLLGK